MLKLVTKFHLKKNPKRRNFFEFAAPGGSRVQDKAPHRPTGLGKVRQSSRPQHGHSCRPNSPAAPPSKILEQSGRIGHRASHRIRVPAIDTACHGVIEGVQKKSGFYLRACNFYRTCRIVEISLKDQTQGIKIANDKKDPMEFYQILEIAGASLFIYTMEFKILIMKCKLTL